MDTASLAIELPDRSMSGPGSEPASAAELRLMDAYWRAANYLSVGQIYLYDNPLLREPLTLAHVKPLVVGHWGTTPGQNFIYVHLNRVIKAYDLDMFYIAGPGHGGPALVANTYLEGSYSEIYPNISQDEAGLKKLFTQFSFPGGISSHVAPSTPGSIHEGGELGYSLSHAFGAAFDNPGLIVACIIGDGEAETGPLATAWHSNKLLNPIQRRRRAADPAPQRVQDQQPDRPVAHRAGGAGAVPARLRLDALLRRGRRAGSDAPSDGRHARPRDRRDPPHPARRAAANGRATRPRWPVIVLRSPKGWTGPKVIDGLKIEGTFRAHQVPILVDAAHPGHVADLESWMRSYRAEELFDQQGTVDPGLGATGAEGRPSHGRQPAHQWRQPAARPAYAGLPASMPSRCPRQVRCRLRGHDACSADFLRDMCVKLNQDGHNFRIFGPDETLSNMLGAVFEVTSRQWDAQPKVADDEFLAPEGRRSRFHAERASMRGLAGRLPADRAARAVQQLRGIHPHRRLHVQPARQMAEGHQRAALAAQRSPR